MGTSRSLCRGWVPISPKGAVKWSWADTYRASAIKNVVDSQSVGSGSTMLKYMWDQFQAQGWRIARCEISEVQ